MDRLTELTPAQEARLPEIRDEWIKIGLSTEPLDFERAKDAAIAAYRVVGLKAPQVILSANNPIEGVVMMTMLEVEGLSSVAGTQEEIEANMVKFLRTHGGIRGKYRDRYSHYYSATISGSQDASWLSYYATFLEFGVEACAAFIPLMDLAKSCGWWIPCENAVVLQHRPHTILLDDDGRPHCEDGPAISYRAACPETAVDVYAIHGVEVTRAIIDRDFNLKDIRNTDNAEVRRIMIERYGVERYALESGAKCIHMDMVSVTPGSAMSIPRALFRFDDGSQWLYGTDGSTSRCYWMPVPSEVQTCRQAHFAISGLDDADCVAQS